MEHLRLGRPASTLTQVAGGHTGGYAAALANTSPSGGACTLNDAPNWVATTAAGTYTTSMWARADSPGATLNLRVREYAGSTLVGTATNHLTLTTAWQQLSVAYAPRSVGTSTLDLNAYVSNAPPGNCFLRRRPRDRARIARLAADTPRSTVTPASGRAPLPVVADASGSTDTDAAPIATYAFNLRRRLRARRSADRCSRESHLHGRRDVHGDHHRHRHAGPERTDDQAGDRVGGGRTAGGGAVRHADRRYGAAAGDRRRIGIDGHRRDADRHLLIRLR